MGLQLSLWEGFNYNFGYLYLHESDVVCAFQAIFPFYLNCITYWYIVYHNISFLLIVLIYVGYIIPLFSSLTYITCSFLTSDLAGSYQLHCSFCKGKKPWFHWIFFSIFSFIDFTFDSHHLHSSLFLLFFFFFIKVEALRSLIWDYFPG